MELDRIFKAESVAIIGASRDVTKRGNQAIRTLLDEGYEGKIYPVNPKERNILGLRCYKSVLDIEGDVDIALITTPASTIVNVLRDLGKKGVAGAVVVAGGFGELGEEGKSLEKEMVEESRNQGVRLIGPNTSGMINVKDGLNLVGLKKVPYGSIALLTQSGNIALTLITEAGLKSQKGFNYYVGVGNEADLKFHEYLKYFTDDGETDVILMYVEGLREGRKFLEQARETTKKKPIVLFKSGKSNVGSKSAGSHTGALAGISQVADSAFKRAGIVMVNNSDAMYPIAETLSSLPLVRNNSVAILADGGGHATIAADYLTELGIEIPQLNRETKEKLAEILPFNASLVNPVDIAGGADQDPTVFADCAEILLEDENVGGVLVVGLFGGYGIRFAEKLAFMEEDASHRIGKLIRKKGKPIVLHSLYSYAKPHSLDLLRYYEVPVYDSLEVSCKCMEALSIYGSYRENVDGEGSFKLKWGEKAVDKGNQILNNVVNDGRNRLMENEAKDLLRLHDVPVLKEKLAINEEDAVEIARDMDFNVVMKVVSPDILHKSDVGGVKLEVKDEYDVRLAYRDIIRGVKEYDDKADIRGCLVSPKVPKGVEIIVGSKIDEQFGPIIMFGLGGIMVELIKDVSFRIVPVTRESAYSMIDEIKTSAVLDGIRGESPLDKDCIVDLIEKVSEIVESYPLIYEMDINPAIVYERGIYVVDARVVLGREDVNRKKDLSLSEGKI